MTEPALPTAGGAPSAIVAAVQETLSQARALGLTWTLRMATVSESLPLAVVYDGDTKVIPAVSIIGSLDPGQRVYVLIIPPSGNFVVGSTETTMSRGLLGANATDNGVVVTTPGGGAETAVPSVQWRSEPVFDFLDNRLYMAFIEGFVIESTGGGGTVSLIRVRKGAQTTAGTVLGVAEVFHPAGFGGLSGSFAYSFVFKNTSGATVSTKLSLTVNGIIGAGTWSLSGITGEPLRILVKDIGWVSDNATLANTLISV